MLTPFQANELSASDALDVGRESKTTGRFSRRDRAFSFENATSAFSTLVDLPATEVSAAGISQSDVEIFSAPVIEDTNRFNVDVDQLRLANAIALQSPGVNPRIAINDTAGPAGSIAFAQSTPAFEAVIGFDFGCTGSLIAPNVVISARHCGGGAGSGIYFGAEGLNNPTFTATVTEQIVPAGAGGLLDGGDLSIHILDRDVPADIATPLRFIDETDALVGRTIATLGYGLNGIGSAGHQGTSDGNRWGGMNIIDTYGEIPGGGAGTANIISTDFDDGTDVNNSINGSDPNPLPLEATTAGGDSGGPILVQTPEGEWAIAGVLSGGTNGDSSYGDISWWTGSAIYRDAIEDAGGEFVDATPAVDDHGNTKDLSATEILFNATPIARSQGVIATADGIQDVDVFRFEILRNARIIVDAVSLRGFDPFVKVFNNAGGLIGENNDKPDSLSSQFVGEVDAGIYYVEVSSNDPSDTGRYRIAARHNGAEDDFGGRFSNAQMFSLDENGNTKINGSVETEDDIDMFRFIADRTGEVVARSTAKTGDLNTVLRIFNSARSQIAANNNWNGSFDSRVKFNIVAGESYYVKLGSVKLSQGDFSLNLIPKTESDGTDRGNVDLNLVNSSLGSPSLSLTSSNFGGAARMAGPVQLEEMSSAGPRPLNLIANG